VFDCGICPTVEGYISGSCHDCASVPNGTADFDDCTTPVCSGGSTGLVANASCTDCALVINGTSVEDACGNCAGDCADYHGYGLISCTSIEYNLNNLIMADECGVCGGDGPNEGVDCDGNLLSIEELIPTEYALAQNYPNPFNPNTVISFSLPEYTQVSLLVYDVSG
jgi:hypothetical protein